MDLNFLPPEHLSARESDLTFDGTFGSRELKTRSPAFTDAALTKPGVIHLAKCPAAPSNDGLVHSRRGICKCNSGIRIAPLGSRIAVLLETPISLLCVTNSSAPFWIERLTTREAATGKEDPVRTGRLKLPDDYRALEVYQAEHGPPPSHKRKPERHEIVKYGKTWWRLFTYSGSPPIPILIHPALMADRALSATFRQIKVAGRNGISNCKPVFPLPNGTENPGWK